MFFKKKILVATHNGSFHPDDVFSVALLSVVFDGKIKVVRTRDEKIISKAGFVVDIGFKHEPENNKYDHHQEGGAGKRENGITYSSFGILWKDYGVKACGSEKVANIIDEKLVQVIDADDNGFDLCKPIIPNVYPFLLTDAVYSFKPTWKEENLNIDEAFLKAVDFAKGVLEREIKKTKDKIEAEIFVEEIYKKSEDKKIMIIDEGYFPKSLFSNYPEPLFVVCKEKDGKRWRITTINKTDESFVAKKNFPESWWGKSAEELAKITGVSDAVFCRNGGIFAGTETKEGAVKLAQIAIEE